MTEGLQDLLRCPITKGALREININQIKEVNSRVSKGELLHFDGSPARKVINSGFISLNGKFVYPIEEGIVILLQNLAIVVNKDGRDGSSKKRLRKEKKDVQDFYDQIGWHKGEQGLFVDTLKFVDRRPVCKDYHSKCQLRVNRHLKSSGKYILDAGCGSIPHPERLSYQHRFDFRICVDLSFLALKEARKKLGDKGIYLLADVTDLPLKDNLVDAAVCLHTIYHVPEDEQKKAFEEIYRVLKPASSAVVVYNWGPHSFLMNLAFLPSKVFWAALKRMRMLKRFFTRAKPDQAAQPIKSFPDSTEPKLYSRPHNYRYFINQEWPFDLDIRVFRSVSHRFTETYVHSRLFGKQLLMLIYWLEEIFPHIAGRLGQYPLFVIKK